MKPSIKEAWTESGWFDRFFLVFYAALAVACFARHDGDDIWFGVIAVSLMLWQWIDMEKSVELKRWREAFGADVGRTRSTIEEIGDGFVYRPAATINIRTADVSDAIRKAQQIADDRRNGTNGAR